jgi:PhoPQ-activated pathogenicity-related protein
MKSATSVKAGGPIVGGLVAALAATTARADLDSYIKRPEPAYEWKLKEKTTRLDGVVYDLHLVSQVWQDIKWEHALQVVVPNGVAPNGTMVIWNTGSRPNIRDVTMAMMLAKRVQAPCAFLYGVPNQPLLGNLREDGLIAETFVRFLNTKDANWPLLFPMAKSVVKAMDALQAFTEQEFKSKAERFIVSGASKRGWTSWLSAVVDPRVTAICPMVIDTLNMPKQTEHQLACYGTYSVKIEEYTERGLVPMPKTPEAGQLLKMVDPYSYRDRLTLPKLIVIGANDPYWVIDSLNLYWKDLKGDKWVLYVPNAGHELDQKAESGREGGVSRALNGLAAFARHQTTGKPLPKIDWTHEGNAETLKLTANADQAPKAARLWVAHSPTRDFRKAPWVEQTAKVDGGKVSGDIAHPKEGFCAFYAELDYSIDGIDYHLSTQVRVAGAPSDKK